jgi:pimeloyl-[acyl-carrier protein] methyl ester esterase
MPATSHPGKAITIVLLPGMDGTGKLFAGFVAALGGAAKALVVAYPPDRELGYSELTDFARSQLPPGADFVLLGESFSGPIAIALAAERPPGLVGLVLCCSFARTPVPGSSVLSRLLPLLPLHTRILNAVAPLLIGRTALVELRSALAGVRSSVLRRRLREVLQVDYSVLAASLDLPVLYLRALQDRVVPASECDHLLALIPSMQVVRFAAPHLLLQSSPVAAAASVRAFVGTCHHALP